jgi:hypothetical protein
MLAHINPDYDREGKCVWCGYQFTLIAREMWKDAFTCPSCKKPTGYPINSFGQTRVEYDRYPFMERPLIDGNGNRYGMVPYCEIRRWEFIVTMPQLSIVPFLRRFYEGRCGEVLSIAPGALFLKEKQRTEWHLRVEAEKVFEMDGMTWTTPSRVVAT